MLASQVVDFSYYEEADNLQKCMCCNRLHIDGEWKAAESAADFQLLRIAKPVYGCPECQ